MTPSGLNSDTRMQDLFPHMPVEREQAAMAIYRRLFGGLELDQWIRRGTVITRNVNGRYLNFAARRTHCTLGFRGYDAVQFYRFCGGECPVGEVTIKIPYDRDWNVGPARDTIDWYFHNGPVRP